ncbi:flavin reductase family protein [Streptomyces sp. NPDC059352]|uniref:flavin reductase family protein n=1 Tax=Streptomyces sp. NPDC059352 TaxID=3346810 RepID=UPI0036C1887B
MSRFATGVVVLTVGGTRPHGMTANAFTSVSLDPPSVLCCVAHNAVMHDAITGAGAFGVSIMDAEQEELARFFADKKRPLGPAQFEAVDWAPGPVTGSPLLAGALAWLECEVTEGYGVGDHSVFLGGVVGARRGEGGDGLLFFDGGFHRLSPGAAR